MSRIFLGVFIAMAATTLFFGGANERSFEKIFASAMSLLLIYLVLSAIIGAFNALRGASKRVAANFKSDTASSSAVAVADKLGRVTAHTAINVGRAAGASANVVGQIKDAVKAGYKHERR